MLNIYVCNTWRQLKSPFTVDSSNQNFRYSHESDKPHAVTKVTPSTNFPNAISAADCLTEYNVFNQPTRIAEGDAEILLEYGADNQRVKAVFKRNGQVERTLYYINANYEKEVEADGVTTHYNYVYGATGLAAICVRRNGIDSMYYVHPDRLGSYTHITNANKQVIRNLHFDPWGNVKTDTDWRTFDSTTLSGFLAGTIRFSRGFTGHEHYADLKIINMNGRLYDPVIARFFSPDNFVQAPEFTQSYNRYSYCLNNPLQWVDPSGELSFNDWYIDSKRNLQWFESTSDYVEVNGEIYSRIGSTVIRFSSNGQKIYGDEYGGIHYIYPLGEVVIGWKEKSSPLLQQAVFQIAFGTDRQQEFIFNDEGAVLSVSSSFLSVQSNRYYNKEAGRWLGKNGKYYDFNFNGNGVTGGRNSYAKAKSTRLKVGGYSLSLISSFQTGYTIYQSETIDEKAIATADLLVDAISYTPGIGSLVTLYWYGGGRKLHWLWYQNALMPQIDAGINPGLMIYQPFK